VKSRRNEVKGRIVGFTKGPKNVELVFVDIGRKSDCSVDASEFSCKPEVDKVYDFLITRELDDGSCIISRSMFEKKRTVDIINTLISNRDPVIATVTKKVKNGYIVSVDDPQLSAFLFTAKQIEINDKVEVVLTNYFGSKVKCVLKCDDLMALQAGDIINGVVSSCNDFFCFIKSDKIPESYEANVYRGDCYKQLEVGYEGEFIVLYFDKKNIFLSPVNKDGLNAGIVNDKVYEGTIENVKMNGIFVNVNNAKVYVRSSEATWLITDKLEKIFTVGQKVKVNILSSDEEGNIEGSIRRNGESVDYFKEFIKNKKVGDVVSVIVRDVKTKSESDGKTLSKVVLITPENSEFVMVFHVGGNVNIVLNAKLHVIITGIKEKDYKVTVSIFRGNRRSKNADGDTCTVTNISGYNVYGVLNDGTKGKIRGSAADFEVGNSFVCKVKRNGHDFIFIPLNYNTTSNTVIDSTFADLFDLSEV
jgi:ribosomal protein S1